MVEFYINFFYYVFACRIGLYFIDKMSNDDTLRMLYIKYNALRRLKTKSK